MVGLRRGSVLLVPHRSEWGELFEEEAARLRSALGGGILGVEHVGSTAVEGMEAKPLIDMVAAVANLDEARCLVPALEGMGYEHRDDGGVRGRIFLAKGPRTRRTHHLSLTEPTSDHWQKSLLFRDYLRAHPKAAEEYRLGHNLRDTEVPRARQKAAKVRRHRRSCACGAVPSYS